MYGIIHVYGFINYIINKMKIKLEQMVVELGLESGDDEIGRYYNVK